MPMPCRAGKQYKQSTQTGSGVPRSLVALVMLRHVRRTETLTGIALHTSRTDKPYLINNSKDEITSAKNIDCNLTATLFSRCGQAGVRSHRFASPVPSE